MANNQNEEDQIQTLLGLSSEQLATQLAGMLAQDQAFLQLAMPQTEPPMTPEQFRNYLASLNPKKQIQEMMAALKRVLDKGENALKQRICIDLRYCDRKGHELLKLLRDIAGLLIMAGVITWHPVPLAVVLTAVVYLYKNGYFDKLCKCPK
jgi:hypothetical protein